MQTVEKICEISLYFGMNQMSFPRSLYLMVLPLTAAFEIAIFSSLQSSIGANVHGPHGGNMEFSVEWLQLSRCLGHVMRCMVIFRTPQCNYVGFCVGCCSFV